MFLLDVSFNACSPPFAVKDTLKPGLEASAAGLKNFASTAASAAIWFQSLGRGDDDSDESPFHRPAPQFPQGPQPSAPSGCAASPPEQHARMGDAPGSTSSSSGGGAAPSPPGAAGGPDGVRGSAAQAQPPASGGLGGLLDGLW